MQLKYEFEAYVVICVYIYLFLISLSLSLSLSNNSVERRSNVDCVFIYNIVWISHSSHV